MSTEPAFIERPAILRDRDYVVRAVAHALLASTVHQRNRPDGTLRELTVTFLRDLGAHGVEVRRRRSTRR